MFHKQETIRDIYNLKRSMAELQDRVLFLEGVIFVLEDTILEAQDRVPDADDSGG